MYTYIIICIKREGDICIDYIDIDKQTASQIVHIGRGPSPSRRASRRRGCRLRSAPACRPRVALLV